MAREGEPEYCVDYNEEGCELMSHINRRPLNPEGQGKVVRDVPMAKIRLRRMGSACAAAAIAGALMAACGSPSSTTSAPSKASAKKSNVVLGFSQSYTGNSYRKSEDAAFATEAKKLEAKGELKKYVFEDANNSCSSQESQISDMIIEHVSALLIDPCSGTALNGVIAKAASAHIPVLVFNDGPVTSKVPYELNFDAPAYLRSEVDYVAKRLHGHGNILNVRGIAGEAVEALFQKGFLEGIKKHPGLKVVGTVYGNWTESVAEQKVSGILPSLPTVNAIVTQGGEGYGAIQAFKAAGKKVPLVFGGNRGAFLHWWAAEHKKNGYVTESMSADPGIGAAAAYIGVRLADGKHVPKTMTMPFLTITQSQLASYANVPIKGIASKVYPTSWYKSHLLG